MHANPLPITDISSPRSSPAPRLPPPGDLEKAPLHAGSMRHFPELLFVVAKAPGLEDEFYQAC